MITKNKILLDNLADLFAKNKHILARANSDDIGTNLQVNIDNIERGIASIKAYASIGNNEDLTPAGGIAIYSCYGDPSFVTLGLCLPPAILANGNDLPIYIYFPSALANYRRIFEEIIREGGLFQNLYFFGSHQDFFNQSIASPEIQTLVVFGDEWVDSYLDEIRAAGKTLFYFGPGNNTAIILDDSNLQHAVKSITSLTTIVSGQAAVCLKRCIVSSGVNFDYLLELLKNAFSNVKTGCNPETDTVTPVYYKSIAEVIDNRIKKSVAEGSKQFNFGISSVDCGHLVNPTIVINPNADSDLWNTYHFAPVLSIMQCCDQEIVKLVRQNDYQLAVSIFGSKNKGALLKDLQKDHAFVFDNADFLDILTAEDGYCGYWGGYKKSAFIFSKSNGYQKEGGKFDLFKVFTQT